MAYTVLLLFFVWYGLKLHAITIRARTKRRMMMLLGAYTPYMRHCLKIGMDVEAKKNNRQ